MEHILTDDQYDNALELLHLFKIDGKPADEIATPGQVELFGRIVFRMSLRQFIMTETQYGKSLFVALACIILTALVDLDSDDVGEKVIVGAPTEEKAMIIMRYYNQHLGDSPLFAPLLDASTKIERLTQSATKDALVLKGGGMMFALTLNATNGVKGFEAAMGEGSDVVILDEACLVPDTIEATVFRMIVGRPHGMYVKIGNPFYRGTHFQKASRDPAYLKLIIDYNTAIVEGRISHATVDEARTKPYFDILYECKFPGEQQQDKKGYTILYKEQQMDIAYMENEMPLIGEKHIGIDVSGGGANFSTIVVRGTNMAKLVFRQQTEDPLILITESERVAKEYGVVYDDKHVHVDKTGAIALCARMNELHPFRNDGSTNNFGTTVGEKAEPEVFPNGETQIDERSGKPVVLFINKRAQLAWRGAQWVQGGGKFYKYLPQGAPPMQGLPFDDLLVSRYKIQSDKKIKLKGKDEMADENIPSPDCGDAFNLTFDYKPKLSNNFTQKQPEYEPMTNFGL